jgi:hypothetical protein
MLVRMIAGFVQVAAGVAVAAWWRQRHPVVGPGDTAAQFIHGMAHFVYFLIATVWGWIAMWLFVEGLLRVLAAAMQQPFDTAPVVLARAAWRLRPQAKPLDDLVATTTEGVVIDSVHDYDWHALTTVDVDGALYAVAREAGTRERPHRYRLRPIPHDHVVRTVTRYDPISGRGRDGSDRTGRPLRR